MQLADCLPTVSSSSQVHALCCKRAHGIGMVMPPGLGVFLNIHGAAFEQAQSNERFCCALGMVGLTCCDACQPSLFTRKGGDKGDKG